MRTRCQQSSVCCGATRHSSNTGELTAVLEALKLHGRHGYVPAEAQTGIFESDFAAGVTLDTIQPEPYVQLGSQHQRDFFLSSASDQAQPHFLKLRSVGGTPHGDNLNV